MKYFFKTMFIGNLFLSLIAAPLVRADEPSQPQTLTEQRDEVQAMKGSLDTMVWQTQREIELSTACQIADAVRRGDLAFMVVLFQIFGCPLGLVASDSPRWDGVPTNWYNAFFEKFPRTGFTLLGACVVAPEIVAYRSIKLCNELHTKLDGYKKQVDSLPK